MLDEAKNIFDYLPIERDPIENEYIDHLWETFCSLESSKESVRPFVMMPYHLLFMLVVQYKVLRINVHQKNKYDLALTIKNPREDEMGILNPESPLALGYISESEIIDLLKIIGLTKEKVQNIKKQIIRYRNDKLAHAKGYMEPRIEEKINEYLNVLQDIQGCLQQYNLAMAEEWLTDLTGEDDIEDMLDGRLKESLFTPQDYGDVIEMLLSKANINYEQWTSIISKGFEYAEVKTLSALINIALKSIEYEKRFNAIKSLDACDGIDETIKKMMLKKETNPEIIKLIKGET